MIISRIIKCCFLLSFFLSFSVKIYCQKKIDSDYELGISLYKKSDLFFSEPDSMLFYAKKALEYIGDSKNFEAVSNCLLNISIAKIWLGKIVESKKYAVKTLKYIDKNIVEKNLTYTIALNVLASYYDEVGDFENAKKLYKESILINKRMEVGNYQLSSNYLNLGFLNLKYGEIDEGIACTENAYALSLDSKEDELNSLGVIHMSLGMGYSKNGQIEKAKFNYKKSLEYLTNYIDKYNIQNQLTNYQGLAKIYLEEKKMDSTRLCLQIRKNSPYLWYKVSIYL